VADLDYETVEAWDDEGNRHVTRILAHEPPATDTTLIPTAELEHLRREVARFREALSKLPYRCVNPWPCPLIRELDGEEA
jgi:hypothetical protein